MKRTIFSLLTLVFGFVTGYGQSCALTEADQLAWGDRYEKLLTERGSPNRSVLIEIPIAFHLLSRDNGVGGLTPDRCLTLLCELNEIFEFTRMRFFLAKDGIQQINHDGIFNAPYVVENLATMRTIKKDAINVFIVNRVSENNALGSYNQQEDWILIQKSGFSPGNKTLAHEIGHFFALYHTHFGWESKPWSLSDEGKRSPVVSSDGVTPTEWVNRINCAVAGDKLCDTQADYNMGLNFPKSCEFQALAFDPQSVQVNPDETLIMSYFQDSCRFRFSDEQIQIMRSDAESDYRSYLHQGFVPQGQSIGYGPTLISPLGIISSAELSNPIGFRWKRVEDANMYYVTFDRSQNFNLSPVGFITSDTMYKFDFGWLENTNYFWKVTPFNEQFTCAPTSEVFSFRFESVTSTKQAEQDVNWNVYVENQILVLNGLSTIEKPHRVNVYRINGALIKSIDFHAGDFQDNLRISIPEISSGVYTIQIIGNHNIFSKSLLVLR